jgi:hypothetical protein
MHWLLSLLVVPIRPLVHIKSFKQDHSFQKMTINKKDQETRSRKVPKVFDAKIFHGKVFSNKIFPVKIFYAKIFNS